jgi:hypothetical protein
MSRSIVIVAVDSNQFLTESNFHCVEYVRIVFLNCDDPRVRTTRHSEHIGFLQAPVCVYSRTHNVTNLRFLQR